MLTKLVLNVCPNFPEDRRVIGSPDPQIWYKTNQSQRCLYTPTYHILRSSPREIDRFIEAVQSYAISDVDSSEYDWDHLNLYHASTERDALNMLNIVQMQARKSRILACDIETRRVELMDNRLLAIGFATDANTSYAISGPFSAAVLDRLNTLFRDPLIAFTWQNGKFDCTRLKWLVGVNARVDEDVMLRHYAQINEKKGTHGLKMLAQLYLQAPAWEDALDEIKYAWCREHKTRLEEFMYDFLPVDVLIPYMQRDTIATFRLLEKFKRLARPGSEFIYRKLVEASNTLVEVELNGLPIDFNYLEQLEFELDKEIDEAKDKLGVAAAKSWDPEKYRIDTGSKRAPEKFNPKSPKQLKWILKETLHIDLSSTDAKHIKELLEHPERFTAEELEVLRCIQSWRQLSKYMDTYVQGFRERICDDFRLRGTFNLHGTETGRLSSSAPNLQNIPGNARIKNLICARPGYKLVQFDYSQAELRVLALLSQDPFLMDVYIRGDDLHDKVAEQMFGVPFDKAQRNMAKTINFGIAYGRGAPSIAEAFKISMAEANKLIDNWYKPMPVVKKFIQMRRGMPAKGEPCISLFGRERHFLMTAEMRNHIENEYINTPIQSLASDLTLFSLMELHEYLVKHKLDARIIITVHDSIILEVKDDARILAEVATVGCDIMAKVPKKFIPDCQVPFLAKVEVGQSWGDVHEVDYMPDEEEDSE